MITKQFLCDVGDKVIVKGVELEVTGIYIDTHRITYEIDFDCNGMMSTVGCPCPFYDENITWEGECECQCCGCLSFTTEDFGKTVYLKED